MGLKWTLHMGLPPGELVSLRTQIYAEAGKHDGATDMVDKFDGCAIHVAVWKNGSAIASARVVNPPPIKNLSMTGFLFGMKASLLALTQRKFQDFASYKMSVTG